MQFSKIAAAAAVALTMSHGAVTAAPITGSVAIDFGAIAGDGTPLSAGDILAISGGVSDTPASGDFAALVGSTISGFSVTLSLGAPVVFSGVGGGFSGVITSLTFPPPAGTFANAVSIDGTFTPTFGGFSPNLETQVNLSFAFLGGAYSGGGVMGATATTSDVVPEPLSLSLFGLGLAGLGVAMRRRPKASQSA